jgi:hypothetical protein
MSRDAAETVTGRWEYRTLDLNFTELSLSERLVPFGDDGWELCAVSGRLGNLLVLKRPVPPVVADSRATEAGWITATAMAAVAGMALTVYAGLELASIIWGGTPH